jgi:hypothetical protein
MKLVVRPKGGGRRPLRAAIAALLGAAATLVPVAIGTQAAGAVGSCSWHISTPVISRGAGSGGWSVSFIPTDPDQSCSTTITTTAEVAVAGDGLPSNIIGDPSTITFAAHFIPGSFPPGMTWSFSPYCADPGANLVIIVSAGGQSSSTPTSASSCSPDFGGHSQIGPLPGVATGDYVVGMAKTASGLGYWEASAQGLLAAYGDAGDTAITGLLRAPIVGAAATPSGLGTWLAASDGGVFTFGNAGFHGSLGGVALNKPIVGMAATPSGNGYWLVASDGGVFTFGDAGFYGSTGNVALTKPVVGMAATPSGHGYWLVASDGGIFTFGDAVYHGSTGAIALDQPVVGMAKTMSGAGYWLVASDGGIFTFGDAVFYGSQPLNDR